MPFKNPLVRAVAPEAPLEPAVEIAPIVVEEVKAPEPKAAPLTFRAPNEGEKMRDVVGAALAVQSQKVADMAPDAEGYATEKKLFERIQRLHMMLEYNPNLTGEGF